MAILKSADSAYDRYYIAMPNSKPEELPTELEDRRRSPRVSCAGLAKIISLPSDGLTGPAKVLNLSLGGCGIETDFPLKSGTRAEILLQVNGSSFRATCQVRALRAPHGIGLEFVHLSTLGQDMLKELIRELGRQRAIASTLIMGRRKPDPKQWNGGRAALFNANVPIIGSARDSEHGEGNSRLVDRVSLILDRELDLFI
jgi:hypothetical protein